MKKGIIIVVLITLSLILFRPTKINATQANSWAYNLQEITRADFKSCTGSLECNNIFKEFETIKIPHVGKSDYFKYEDLLKIEYDAIEISNKNNRNFKSFIKHKDIQTSIVAFSDTHD